MGKVAIHENITVNGASESPSPETWLEMDADSSTASLEQAVPALKAKHSGNLIVSGCGELAHTLTEQGLADEFWFWVTRTCGARGRASSTVSDPSPCASSIPPETAPA